MPDDTITLVSTTDSAEEVQAALTNRPVAEVIEETAGETPETPETPDAPETPEQEEAREAREASDAGSALAKRKAKIQHSIDAEIRRKNDLRRDAEAEEARLNDLRRQRLELEAQFAAPAAPAPDPEPVAAGAPLGRPEPKLDALGADGDAKYATYEDYLSDHAAWAKEEAILGARQVLVEKDHADRARIERESTSRVVNDRLATFNTQLEAFKKTHADFDAAFAEAKESVQETLVGIGPNALKVVDGFTVFDAQDGPALMYHLLKRPDELKAIVMKAPPQQLIHLARLDASIRPAGAKRNGGPSAADLTTSKVPEPIRPVGSGPTATSVSPDEESFQDYRARRNRELRARQGHL